MRGGEGGGEENRSQSRVSDTGRVAARPWVTCAHKQRGRRPAFSRRDGVSAPSDTRRQPGRAEKTDKLAFFSPSFYVNTEQC